MLPHLLLELFICMCTLLWEVYTKVPGVYLITRLYKFLSLYYVSILIFLTCKQQITQIIIFELWLFNTERIFIIASVFDTA